MAKTCSSSAKAKAKAKATSSKATATAAKAKSKKNKHKQARRCKPPQQQSNKKNTDFLPKGFTRRPLDALEWRRIMLISVAHDDDDDDDIKLENDNKKKKAKTNDSIPTAATTTSNNTTMVPYTLNYEHDLFWPSALFFNADYANGILVPGDNNNDTNNEKKNTTTTATTTSRSSNDYFVHHFGGYSNNATDEHDGFRTLPYLTETEQLLWGHKHAAHTAVARRFPVEVSRLLGTITLEIQETTTTPANVTTGNDGKISNRKKKCTKGIKLAKNNHDDNDNKSDRDDSSSPLPQSLQVLFPSQTFHRNDRIASLKYRNVKKIAFKQCHEEARLELLKKQQEQQKDQADSVVNVTNPTAAATADTITATNIEMRAKEIQDQWNVVEKSNTMYRETWDREHGDLTHIGRHDPHYVPLRVLQTWLQNETIQDLRINNKNSNSNNDKTNRAYDGLTTGLPTNNNDALDIVKALVSLSHPQSDIYGVPLVAVYPRMERVKTPSTAATGKSNKRSSCAKVGIGGEQVWKVQIGIYMHRLLPEIFITESLHIVMSALDEGSYKISHPLQLLPQGEAVFESAEYPKVDLACFDQNGDGNVAIDDSVMMSDSDDSVTDGDMEGGSRDDMVLSPFSTKGLLKMLENKGCDVSEWSKIEQELQGKFQLELLLHQQHAICWMIQMEHLKGAYGINSLFWEERTFPDGGHFYYSPALGQVRLGAPPPHMKGGLLCDEQGLGKTVEVLGLIMATLSELKKAAESASKVAYNYDDGEYYSAQSDDEDDCVAHTTLIIVPPALLVQWLHEIEKAVGNTLTVSMIVARSGELKRCLPLPAEGEAASTIVYDCDDDWETMKASDIMLCTYDCFDKNSCSRILQTVRWGRVVLDEMQEIRSSTTQIAKNCETLKCNRRWMLSGTPIFQGIQDLSGELNFLRLEPFGSGQNDGFYKFAVVDPWEAKSPRAINVLKILGLIALRRSKDMTVVGTGTRLLDLKPLTVDFHPVPQSHSERALYCWMEYLVAEELRYATELKKRDGLLANGACVGALDTKSRQLCLRLLRETCITPLLLNGGIGVSSQLGLINQLMIARNRREHQHYYTTNEEGGCIDRRSRKKRAKTNVMSCERALRFLTQHQEDARTDEDFISDEVVGGGRGVTNRDRATESVEERVESAKKVLAGAERVLAKAKARRAKARWHWLLEMVTTGKYNNGVLRPFSGLWNWRRAVCAAGEQVQPSLKMATLLTRGWRPSQHFEKALAAVHPGFLWAQPNMLLIENIPGQVTGEELAVAFYEAAKIYQSVKAKHAKGLSAARKLLDNYEAIELTMDLLVDLDNLAGRLAARNLKIASEEVRDKITEIEGLANALKKARAYDARVTMPLVTRIQERKHDKGFWQAYVQFEQPDSFQECLKSCSRSAGAPIKTGHSVPHIHAIEKAFADYVSQLESECQVHASAATNKLLTKAKKDLMAFREGGLRLLTRSNKFPEIPSVICEKAGTSSVHIHVETALGNKRALVPSKAATLSARAQMIVTDSASIIFEQQQTIHKSSRVLQQFKRNGGRIPDQIQQLSAYDVIQALINGEQETKTQCCICLGYLGETESKNDVAKITMLKCSHFFCTNCINHYSQERIASNQPSNCPSCRKAFDIKGAILVDPDLQDERKVYDQEREASKELVREAARMLEESHGHLDASMWKALYLAFDPPANVSNDAHHLYTAIPREFLAHLRAATGMRSNCKASDRPLPGSCKDSGRCSKIQRLLEDLPTNERCVIFSANKDVLMHLRVVLAEEEIGFQMIYSGQSTDELKASVSNWESNGAFLTDPPPFPCLLVQAGAAASGLTLTSASKMFIMEPFIRWEEEKQAYARLHRLTQTEAVKVKVYYTPVSVESRLLEWRKGAKVPAATCVNKIDNDMTVIVHDMDEQEEEEEDGSSSIESSGIQEDDDDSSTEESEESNVRRRANGVDNVEHEDIAQANYLLGMHNHHDC